MEQYLTQDVVIHLRAVLASIAQFQTSQHLERSEVGCDLELSSSLSQARKDGSLGKGGKCLSA